MWCMAAQTKARNSVQRVRMARNSVHADKVDPGGLANIGAFAAPKQAFGARSRFNRTSVWPDSRANQKDAVVQYEHIHRLLRGNILPSQFFQRFLKRIGPAPRTVTTCHQLRSQQARTRQSDSTQNACRQLQKHAIAHGDGSE